MPDISAFLCEYASLLFISFILLVIHLFLFEYSSAFPHQRRSFRMLPKALRGRSHWLFRESESLYDFKGKMAAKSDVSDSTRTVNPYKQFLYTLSQELTRKNIKDIKMLSTLPAGEAEKIEDGQRLFTALIEYGIITETPDGLEELSEILKLIGRNDLSRRIREFIENRKKPFNVTQGKNSVTPDESVGAKVLLKPSAFGKQSKGSEAIKGTSLVNLKKETVNKTGNNSPTTYSKESYDQNPPINYCLSVESPKGQYQFTADFYEMSSDPHGYCLIITNADLKGKRVKASNPKGEADFDFDVDTLEKVFKDLRFNVEKHEDKTDNEIQSILRDVADKNHASFDCLVVFHLSCQGVKTDISSQLKSSKTLRNKPKLFFCASFQKRMVKDGHLEVAIYGEPPSEADFCFICLSLPSLLYMCQLLNADSSVTLDDLFKALIKHAQLYDLATPKKVASLSKVMKFE